MTDTSQATKLGAPVIGGGPAGSAIAATREDPVNRFAYQQGIAPDHAVSLLITVGENSYLAERPGA